MYKRQGSCSRNSRRSVLPSRSSGDQDDGQLACLGEDGTPDITPSSDSEMMSSILRHKRGGRRREARRPSMINLRMLHDVHPDLLEETTLAEFLLFLRGSASADNTLNRRSTFSG